jgi:hypothetical protein
MRWAIYGRAIVRSSRSIIRLCTSSELKFVILAILLLSPITCLNVEAALARTSIKLQRSLLAQQQAQQRKLNEGSLIILGGFPGTPYFEQVHDIAVALDGSDGLRLIAVDATGGIGSLQDLMLLRGVDLAPILFT